MGFNVTPSNAFLLLSTIHTFLGFFAILAPQVFHDLHAAHPGALDAEKKVYIQCAGTFGVLLGAAWCALNGHATVTVMRTVASRLLFQFYLIYATDVYKVEGVAVWIVVEAVFAAYFGLSHANHPAHGKPAPAVSASPKGRGRSKSPRKSS